MRKGNSILFVVYLILAVYFLNSALSFFTLPAFFAKIDRWILFFGGVFLVFGGINFLKNRRYTY
jgi:hypothetical protein